MYCVFLCVFYVFLLTKASKRHNGDRRGSYKIAEGGARSSRELGDRRGRYRLAVGGTGSLSWTVLLKNERVLTVFCFSFVYLCWPRHRRGTTGIVVGAARSTWELQDRCWRHPRSSLLRMKNHWRWYGLVWPNWHFLTSLQSLRFVSCVSVIPFSFTPLYIMTNGHLTLHSHCTDRSRSLYVYLGFRSLGHSRFSSGFYTPGFYLEHVIESKF